MKIAIIGSRGYPYVYSGYESFVKELSERLVKKNVDVTIYCHKPLFKERPNLLNGINLIYTPSIESKSLSQFSNTFFSVIHAIFKNYDVLFFVNAANGPFGIITKAAFSMSSVILTAHCSAISFLHIVSIWSFTVMTILTSLLHDSCISL